MVKIKFNIVNTYDIEIKDVLNNRWIDFCFKVAAMKLFKELIQHAVNQKGYTECIQCIYWTNKNKYLQPVNLVDEIFVK